MSSTTSKSPPSLRLDWCSLDAVTYACTHWHYSRSVPTTTDVKIGVWETDRFIGALLFSRGANLHIGRPYGLATTEVCELTRVALTTHAASVSRILSIAIRMLKRQAPGLRLIVSYADPAQSHVGGIYQAGNWIYVGETAPGKSIIAGGKRWHHRTHWIAPANGRTIVLLPKHKYLMPLDELMRRQILPLAKPYPKRERSRENAAAPPRAEGGVIPTRSLQS